MPITSGPSHMPPGAGALDGPTDLSTRVPNGRWFYIIVPIMVLCIISYMDRTAIAFAIPGGMAQDLGLSSSAAGLAAGIFFIGYLFLQVPGGALAARGAAKHFLTVSIIVWGVISIATAYVTSETQLIALRFTLGLFEGGMLPVVLTMVAKWFPNQERGRATAVVIMFVPIANIISGPLAGLIIHNFGWRDLMLFEGIFSFVLLVPWVVMVQEDPDKAKWISPEEKAYIVDKLKAEHEELAKSPTVQSASFLQVMRNSAMWKLIVANFFYQSAIYAFVIWLPTVITGLTKTNIGQVGLLSTLPYIGTMIGMYTFGQLSDRSGKRKQYVIIPLLGLALSLLASVIVKDQVWLSFGCLIMAGAFLQSAAPVFWTIPPLLFTPSVAGPARGAINALGNLGGFLGPFLVGWLKDVFGSTDAGIFTLVGFLVISAVVISTLSVPERVRKKEPDLADFCHSEDLTIGLTGGASQHAAGGCRDTRPARSTPESDGDAVAGGACRGALAEQLHENRDDKGEISAGHPGQHRDPRLHTSNPLSHLARVCEVRRTAAAPLVLRPRPYENERSTFSLSVRPRTS